MISLLVLSLSLEWWPWSWSTEEEVKACHNAVVCQPAQPLLLGGAHLPVSPLSRELAGICNNTAGAPWTWMISKVPSIPNHSIVL